MRRRRRKEETSISSLPLWRRRHKNTRGARRRRRRKGRGGSRFYTFVRRRRRQTRLSSFREARSLFVSLSPPPPPPGSFFHYFFLSPFARQQHTHLVTFPPSPLFLFRLPPAGRGRKRPWRLSRLLPHPSGTQDTLRAAVVLDSIRYLLFNEPEENCFEICPPSPPSQQLNAKKRKQQPVRFC